MTLTITTTTTATTTVYAQNQTTMTNVTNNATNATASGGAAAPATNTTIELILTTIPLAQLQAEDSLFNNFTTIANDCVERLADPAYNGTNSTPTPQPICSRMMVEAIEKWCGLELYHADKCLVATKMSQAYVFLTTIN